MFWPTSWNPGGIAYAAGLFEGEGSISVHRGNGKACTPRLDIQMTDPEPLESFMAAFDLGTIYGPYIQKRHGCKNYYTYRVDGYEKCQAIATALWSFLSPRRQEQIRTVLVSTKK